MPTIYTSPDDSSRYIRYTPYGYWHNLSCARPPLSRSVWFVWCMEEKGVFSLRNTAHRAQRRSFIAYFSLSKKVRHIIQNNIPRLFLTYWQPIRSERERETNKTSKIDRANKIDVPYVIRELFVPNLLDKSIFLLPVESFLRQVMSLAPCQIRLLHPFIHKNTQRWNA